MKQLADNRELYDYLVNLAIKLRDRGAEYLAGTVLSASRHSAGLSTEFLGESRIALKKVSESELNTLNTVERAEVANVLSQLQEALDGRRQP